jgi:hypothetical protein
MHEGITKKHKLNHPLVEEYISVAVEALYARESLLSHSDRLTPGIRASP